jgi:hypothetical protein
MRLTRLPVHALLTCLLLFAQQFAVAHSVSHLGKVAPAHTQSCDKCVLSLQLGAGLPSSTPAAHACGVQEQFAAAPATLHTPGLSLAFDSRAPPASC